MNASRKENGLHLIPYHKVKSLAQARHPTNACGINRRAHSPGGGGAEGCQLIDMEAYALAKELTHRKRP